MIVIDKGFFNLDITDSGVTPTIHAPNKFSSLFNSNNPLIDSINPYFIEQLNQIQKEIKRQELSFASKGLKLEIDWDSGELLSYSAKEGFTLSMHEYDALEAALRNYKETLDLVTSGHGMNVSSVIAGQNGIAPNASIIPISTKSESIENLALTTDNGSNAFSLVKALFFAMSLAKTTKIDALNLSMDLNCDEDNEDCLLQYRLFAYLLSEAAKHSIVFFALDNEKNSYFGQSRGQKILVNAAKSIAELYGYPRIIFSVNLEEENANLASGKAFLAADLTLANIGNYHLPKLTNPAKTKLVKGTSFASPANLAMFLLIKEAMLKHMKEVSDETVIKMIFAQTDHFYAGKLLPAGFYGSAFMNINKYANFLEL